MNNLRRLGTSLSIRIPPDEEGFIGRECPNPECEGYFKVQFGTGLKGDNLPCHCPYCGHVDGHNCFYTKAQIEYAKSLALHKISDALIKDLKKLEFDFRPKGGFGIGFSLKVKSGRPIPIRYYREKQLETIVVCDHCTLRYAIYGVFAFCPDCGVHNSIQILMKNLELLRRQIALSSQVDAELADQLVQDALENAVSSFDGFGREICRVKAGKANNPSNAGQISFQNLSNARKRILDLFGFDLCSCVKLDEWDFAYCSFQKRHLIAHKMGIVDESYLKETKDEQAVLGRKITITSEEVESLVEILMRIGKH